MTTARRILIVDDDEELRETLKDQLVLHDEFEVVTAGTASKGMEMAKADHFDLLVYDVSLPDMDGREAVRLLRKGGFKTPIVMLTGNVSDADQILGLDAGANDYITKPFKFAVLLARIRAQFLWARAVEATFRYAPARSFGVAAVALAPGLVGLIANLTRVRGIAGLTGEVAPV